MVRSSFNSRPRLLAGLWALGFVAVLFVGLILGEIPFRAHMARSHRIEVIEDLQPHGMILTTAVNQRLALLRGLRAFVTVETGHQDLDGSPSDEFDAFAADLYSSLDGIRNLAVALNGTYRYVYPIAGNETVMGHDLLQDSRAEVRQDVQQTIDSGKIVISGPYELRQGGLGLVVRQGIYLAGGEYWGLVSIVVDMPPLLAQAGLSDDDGSLLFALRKPEGEVFFGSPEIFSSDPVIYQVPVGDEFWELAAMPRDGWGSMYTQAFWLYWGVGSLILCLVGALVYAIANRQVRMHHEVAARTADLSRSTARLQEELAEREQAERRLEESRRRYESLVNTINGVVWEADAQTFAFTFVSQQAERIFGYPAADWTEDTNFWTNHILEEDRAAALQFCMDSYREKLFYSFEYRMLTADGRVIWVEDLVNVIHEDGRPKTMVGIMIDITEQKQIAADLRESERRFRDILENLNMVAIALDSAGCITFCNDHLLRLTGYSREQLMGRSWFEMFVPGQLHVQKVFEGAVAGDSFPSHYENEIKTASGEMRMLHWNNIVLRGPEGGIIGVASIGIDVTDHLRAQAALVESEERFRLLAENARDLIYRYRFLPQPGFEYVSQSAEAMTGYTPEEHYADPMLGFKLVYPEDRHLLEDMAALKKDPSAPLLLRWVRKDGVILWAEQRNRYIFDGDGRIIAMEGIARDVTERMLAQQEIQRLNEELEQRVSDRTAELQAANQELEAFAYSVAHDLRSPLRSLDGYSLALLDDYAAGLDETGQHYLTRIRSASQRMGRIIEDLLWLSSAARSQLHFEEVDLTALSRQIDQDLREQHPGRQVEFLVEEGLTARGDEQLLRVALAQLLGNAWKFTGERENAQVRLARSREGTGTLGGRRPVFMVSDNGAGFDMTYADKLFLPFHRLHTAGEFAGEGIGLAIVQRIIQRHGGRIWAESTIGKGAAFFFDLGGHS